MQEQSLTYCVTCKRKTIPTRGGFHIAWVIILLILGVLPGIIYIVYYYLKDLQCPRCGNKNWGSPDDFNNELSESSMNTQSGVVPTTQGRDVDSISLTGTKPGTIQIMWNAPNEVPRDYHLVWANTNTSFKSYDDLSGNAFPISSPYSIVGLNIGEDYKIMVRARYNDGYGKWSGEFIITAPSSN